MPEPDSTLGPLPVLDAAGGGSGSSTAKTAIAMLTQGDETFRAPTRAQRRNLARAFAAKDCIVYGRAFDAVRIPNGVDVDLDDLESVESNLPDLVLYEIKSTNRTNLGGDFKGYFFALTSAELLVAQSLGEQFRFLLIHTLTGDRVELTLQDLLKRARSIYPSWSILF
jgi:hypothetical protein